MNRFRSVHWRIAGRSSGLCVGRELRYGDWRERARAREREREREQLRASRTERKLWLASFHQDATIARSNAAILLRSAPPSQQLPPDPRSWCSLLLAPVINSLTDYSLCIIVHICINNVGGISEVNTPTKRLYFQFLLPKNPMFGVILML